MGRGLGACKGKNPEEKGVSTLLMGTFCTVWGPFGTQSHTSPSATALCSGAVALFHAVPAMDTDPYAGHGRNWWIRGFFFFFPHRFWQLWLPGVAGTGTCSKLQGERHSQGTRCSSERCSRIAAFSERIKTRMRPVLLSLTEPESTDKA